MSETDNKKKGFRKFTPFLNSNNKIITKINYLLKNILKSSQIT